MSVDYLRMVHQRAKTTEQHTHWV